MPASSASSPVRRALPALLGLAALAVFLAHPAAAQDGGGGHIFPDLTGQALLDKLRETYAPTCGTCRVLGYGPARDALYRYEQRTDGALTGVYTGFRIHLDPSADASADAHDKGINAEHTFPQSRGAAEEPAKSDLHHLFPAKANVNSSRNNHPYAEIPDAETDTWYHRATDRSTLPGTEIDAHSEKSNDYPGQRYTGRFEPREDHAGNAARAVFYFFAIYQPRADEAFFRVQRAALLDWHRQDAADDEERARSAWIKSQQGTANPFVLDPTLARRAFEEGSFGEGRGGEERSWAAPGDLVVSELMADPDAVRDADGEYVEVYNRTANPIDLEGYVFSDASGNSHQIAHVVTVPAQGVVVLGASSARSQNGGLSANYVYGGGVSFNQDGDTVHLTAGNGTEVTRMSYGAASVQPGVAFQLISPAAGADGVTRTADGAAGAAARASDYRASDYEAASVTFGDGDRGSPGTASFGALPVELGPFTAQVDGRAVLLRWTTFSETNNRGFRVERQVGSLWERTGFRASRAPGGTSTKRMRYRFRVEGLAPGRHRFRLAQVDLGGGPPTYSRIAEARVALGSPHTLVQRGPHPVRGDARFNLSVSEAQHVEAAAYDARAAAWRCSSTSPWRPGSPSRWSCRARGWPRACLLRARAGAHVPGDAPGRARTLRTPLNKARVTPRRAGLR